MLEVAARPGTDDAVFAVTSDGTIWRSNGVSDWDSVWTTQNPILGNQFVQITPHPISPDSLILSYVTSNAMSKDARSGSFSMANTYVAPWAATGGAGFDSVYNDFISGVIRLPSAPLEPDTLIGVNRTGYVLASPDGGRTWAAYNGVSTNAFFSGGVTHLVVIPDPAGDLLVVAGRYIGAEVPVKAARTAVFGYGAHAVRLHSGDAWKAISDNQGIIENAYDVVYDEVENRLYVAADDRLYAITGGELVAMYDDPAQPNIDLEWLLGGSYAYALALAVDGTDLIFAESSGNVERVAGHGFGPRVDYALRPSGGLRFIPTGFAVGATKLFMSSAGAGVYVADLTGGTPYDGSISGRIEINGAVPPVGSYVAVWVGNATAAHGDIYIASQATTDALGNYTIEQLTPGAYTVAALGPEGRIPFIDPPGVAPGPFSDATVYHSDGITAIVGVDMIFDGSPEWGVGRGEFQSLSVPIAVGREVMATINSPDWADFDWYYVPLDSGDGITIEVEPKPTGIFSPGIELYNGAGGQLGGTHAVYNWDGGSIARQGAVAPDDAGLFIRIMDYNNYTKQARSEDGSFNHRYTLRIGAAAAMEAEPNDTYADATPLARAVEMVGVTDPEGAGDVFGIVVDTPGATWIEVNHNNAGTIYSLLDAGGVAIEGGYTTSHRPSSSFRLDADLAAGTYYLQIACPIASSHYAIVWGSDDTEPNDDLASATGIMYGDAMHGMSLGHWEDADVFAFAGEAGDVVRIDLRPRDVDGERPIVDLYNADSSYYRRGVLRDQENDLAHGGSRIVAVLPETGQYHFVVGPDLSVCCDYSEGAGALYDVSLTVVSRATPDATEPGDLFVDLLANNYSPSIALDGAGNRHYVWANLTGQSGLPGGGQATTRGRLARGANGGSSASVMYAKVSSDGQMLVAPSMVSPAAIVAGARKPSASASVSLVAAGDVRPTVAVDSRGFVHVAWLSMGYAYNDVQNIVHLWFDPAQAANDGSTLTDSGVDLRATVPIVDNVGGLSASEYASWGEVGLRMLLGDGDLVHLLWEQEFAIRYAVLTPNGNLLNEPFTLDTFEDGFNKGPDAAMDGMGRVHVVWNRGEQSIRYAMLVPGGPSGELSGVKPTTIGGENAWVGLPTIAVGPQGVVHVAWTEATEPLERENIRHAEVFYTQVRPDLAPAERPDASGASITAFRARIVSDGDDWPSVQPNLIVGEDGAVYVSWHEFGQGTGTTASAPMKVAGRAGPTDTGIRIGRINPDGTPTGPAAVVDAEVPWAGWLSDPSPVVVDADGIAHVAWTTGAVQDSLEGMWYYFNKLRVQEIPLPFMTDRALQLVAVRWDDVKDGAQQAEPRQIGRAAPGDTVMVAVFANYFADPITSMDAHVEFDPTVLDVSPDWSFIYSSFSTNAFNVQNGRIASFSVASGAPVQLAGLDVEGSEPAVAFLAVVREEAALLTQTPLTFVYDPEGGMRTIVDERRIAARGAVLSVGLFGDASVDGNVTAFDASAILQSVVGVVGEAQYPGLTPALCDVSAVGGVTSYDASLVLQYAAMAIDEFPIEQLSNGAWRPAGSSGRTYAAGFGAPRMDGELFLLPIRVDHLTGIGSGMVEFDLPSAVGTLEAVRTPDGTGLVAYKRDGDHVVAAFANPVVGPDGRGGDVLQVVIRAGGTNLAGAVRLTRVVLNEGDNTVDLGNTEASLSD